MEDLLGMMTGGSPSEDSSSDSDVEDLVAQALARVSVKSPSSGQAPRGSAASGPQKPSPGIQINVETPRTVSRSLGEVDIGKGHMTPVNGGNNSVARREAVKKRVEERNDSTSSSEDDAAEQRRHRSSKAKRRAQRERAAASAAAQTVAALVCMEEDGRSDDTNGGDVLVTEAAGEDSDFDYLATHQVQAISGSDSGSSSDGEGSSSDEAANGIRRVSALDESGSMLEDASASSSDEDSDSDTARRGSPTADSLPSFSSTAAARKPSRPSPLPSSDDSSSDENPYRVAARAAALSGPPSFKGRSTSSKARKAGLLLPSEPSEREKKRTASRARSRKPTMESVRPQLRQNLVQQIDEGEMARLAKKKGLVTPSAIDDDGISCSSSDSEAPKSVMGLPTPRRRAPKHSIKPPSRTPSRKVPPAKASLGAADSDSSDKEELPKEKRKEKTKKVDTKTSSKGSRASEKNGGKPRKKKYSDKAKSFTVRVKSKDKNEDAGNRRMSAMAFRHMTPMERRRAMHKQRHTKGTKGTSPTNMYESGSDSDSLRSSASGSDKDDDLPPVSPPKTSDVQHGKKRGSRASRSSKSGAKSNGGKRGSSAKPALTPHGTRHSRARSLEKGSILSNGDGARAMDAEKGKFLATVTLFQELTDEERAVLGGAMEKVNYKDGDQVIARGQVGRGFYVIRKGSVAVMRKGVTLDLEAKECFGEAASLPNPARGARVEARGATVCYMVPKEKLPELFSASNGVGNLFAKRRAIRSPVVGPSSANIEACPDLPAVTRQPSSTELRSAMLVHSAAGAVANSRILRPADATRTKSAKVTELIMKAIRNNVLFEGMSEAHALKVVSKMWKIQVKKGDKVISQGETGDNVYVVEKGKMYVFITSADGKKEKRVNKLKAGSCFGELALTYDTPRNATLVAAAPTTLWTVDRFTFRVVLHNVSNELLKKYNEIIKRTPLFERLDLALRAKVVEALEGRSYKDGEQVIKEGDIGDEMFVIMSGHCRVTKRYEGDTYEVNRLTKGDVFGERALVKSQTRSATVTAIGKLEVLVLSRPAYVLLLQSLNPVLQDKISEYNRNDATIIDGACLPMQAEDAVPELLPGANSFVGGDVNDMRLSHQGRYTMDTLTVLGSLGSGSFGHVSLVQDPETGETFACKSLDKMHIVRTRQQKHVVNEKNILTRLSQDPHPCIVRLYATMKTQNRLFFLLEPMLGGELFTLLRVRSVFSNKEARWFAASVVLGLEHMHNMKIVYRDLKPENVLLDKEGYLKISDFGFAKFIPGGRTKTLCGTPHYLAPDVIQAKGHGFAVDWWTVGVLIYEMISGTTPFSAPKPIQLYKKILKGNVSYSDHFSPDAKDVVSSFLQRKPSARLGVVGEGPAGIKTRPWFQSFDWDGLLHHRLRAPIIPYVANNTDMKNFQTDAGRKRVQRKSFDGDQEENWDCNF